jgi:hypothetical protein
MEALDIPYPLPDEGFKIPLRAAFTGIKNVPHLALTHSSISPKLTLYNTEIEYGVVRGSKKPYSDIERVEVFQTIATNNVIFIWQDSMFTFTANLRHEEHLPELLRFLQSRMVQLSGSAHKVLEEAKKGY